MKFYTGIGSRNIPDHVGRVMTSMACRLNEMGHCLVSGNAEGSDQAFARGVNDSNAQIWLPWKNFNQDFQDEHPLHHYELVKDDDWDAWESVEKFHPNPKSLSENGWKFMRRNYRQVIGFNGLNSEFVICWTPDGKDSGGPGFAMKVAKHYNIPIFNLYLMTDAEILKEIIKLGVIF